MLRRCFTLAVSLLLLFCMIPSAAAVDDLPMVIDNADLMTEAEENILREKALELREEYDWDIVILTVDTLEGSSAQSYADDYYDQNGYRDDGILLLLAMQEREWYISTCGDAIYALADYAIQQLGENIIAYLSDGAYYEAFSGYLDEIPYYLSAYLEDTPVDGYAEYSGDYYHGQRETIVYSPQKSGPNLFLSLMIGIVAATIVILVMRGSMNTKRPRNNASSYLKSGTFHLRSHQDLFLYSNISKVRRQQNTGSGGRSGGGSSVHRSSSGRRHGGGGGRF